MRKLLAVSTLALILGLNGEVLAQSTLGGGFTGPSAATVTVAEALKYGDDTPIVMIGHIEKALGGEKYLFKDATGTITLDIDNEKWNGENVSPQDTVEISGEIDKDFTKRVVDVDKIVKK